MKFDEAVEYILEFEGGYVNDSNDPGGETKFGISKRSFPNLDIKNLSRDQAKEIYRSHYWVKCQCDLLPPCLRLMVFDCAVNQGSSRAGRILQESVKATIDGVIGPETLRAARTIDAADAVSFYAMRRHQSYTRNPRWGIYGAGWSKRLLDVALVSALWIK